MMRLVLVAVMLCGCVTQPPRKAYDIRDLGDAESVKQRRLSERLVIRYYDRQLAKVWRDWKAYKARVDAIKPDGPLSPDDVLEWTQKFVKDVADREKSRDAKLYRISDNRARELAQARQLNLNAIRATSGLLEGWSEQGKASAANLQALREAVVEGASIYGEYRKARSIQKQAEEAMRREDAEGGE